jgi:hypothetical protein
MSANTSRQDGHTYIDDPHVESESTRSQLSGSSIAEEDTDEVSPPQSSGDADGIGDVAERIRDFASLDERRRVSDQEVESDDDEFDIHDEDWEFADGGASTVDLSIR